MDNSGYSTNMYWADIPSIRVIPTHEVWHLVGSEDKTSSSGKLFLYALSQHKMQ